MALTRRFAGNFFIQTLGRIFAVLVGLVSIGVLTRSLGTDRFGEYTTAMTFLQLFGVVVDFGLTLTLVVMISEKGADEKKIVGNFFSMRLLSGLLFFSLAPITVLAFPWSDTIKTGVAVGAVAYVLMAGATMLVGIFQKHQSMWRAALAELLNRIVLLGMIVTFASLHLGVVAMISASIVANGVWLFATIYLARPFVHIQPQFDLQVWKQALTKSWPIALSIIFNLLYLKGDILFLAYFRESSEVGLYGVAYKVIDVLTSIPVMFMGLLLPSLVADWTAGNVEAFRTHLSKSYDIFMIGVIPIIVGAQAVAEPLVTLIAGEDFVQSGRVLQLLILAVLGVFLGSLWGHAVVAINKQRAMIWGYAAVAVISIVGYILYIPPYGMWGAVWVTLVSEALIAVLTFLMVYRTSRALPRAGVTIKAIFSAILMYLVLVWVPQVNVLVHIALGATIYFFVLYALGGITRNDLAQLIPAWQPKHPPHS